MDGCIFYYGEIGEKVMNDGLWPLTWIVFILAIAAFNGEPSLADAVIYNLMDDTCVEKSYD